MRLWLLTGFLLLATSPAAQRVPDVDRAWLQLQQGDFAGLQALLPILQSSEPAQAEVLALTLRYRRDGQLDEAALAAVQARYPDEPWLQFRAGQLWARRAREANLFTVRGYAKRYTAATRRAAELAPTEPRLLIEAAIAAGQPAMFGGEPERQAAYVDKLATLDPHYHLIGQMDLAQNVGDERAGRQLIETVRAHHGDQLLLLARAGHLAWTYEDEPLAQQLFLRACEHPTAAQQEEPWARWADACSNAAALAADGHGDPARSASALAHHLLSYPVNNEAWVELKELQQQLQQRAQP